VALFWDFSRFPEEAKAIRPKVVTKKLDPAKEIVDLEGKSNRTQDSIIRHLNLKFLHQDA